MYIMLSMCANVHKTKENFLIVIVILSLVPRLCLHSKDRVWGRDYYSVCIILLQVEDKDDSTVSTAWTGLTDLVKSLLHISDSIIVPDHVHKSRDGKYTPSDSMVQYAQLFNQIRKSGGK